MIFGVVIVNMLGDMLSIQNKKNMSRVFSSGIWFILRVYEINGLGMTVALECSIFGGNKYFFLSSVSIRSRIENQWILAAISPTSACGNRGKC